MKEDYEVWWCREGSGYTPKKDEDTEEFVHRLTRIAWLNGEYIAELGILENTCRHCGWYTDIDKSFKICKLYDIAHGADFGCNKFIRRNTKDNQYKEKK